MATRTRKRTPVAKAETIASGELRCNVCGEKRPITRLAVRTHTTKKYSASPNTRFLDSVECVLLLVYCVDVGACSEKAYKGEGPWR